MTTIMFTSSNTWTAHLLSWFMGSTVSHSIIGLDINGVPMALHAIESGVQLVTRASLAGTYKIEYEFEILTPNLQKHIDREIVKIGTPYDYGWLLGYLVVIIGRWFHAKWKNPFASAKAVICSEFILGLDVDGDILEWNGLDTTSTTPVDLLKTCQTNKYGSFRAVK